VGLEVEGGEPCGHEAAVLRDVKRIKVVVREEYIFPG
jgi:hypothetical protein